MYHSSLLGWCLDLFSHIRYGCSAGFDVVVSLPSASGVIHEIYGLNQHVHQTRITREPYVTFLWCHDDVIKWRHFPRYWPFVRGIHRSSVNSPHKGQWRRALMFSLTCVWINGWVNNREAGDLRRHRVHYDVALMRCIPTDTWRNDNVIITSKRCRFDIIMTLSLRRMATGYVSRGL